jgi:hypothetical protein
MRIYGFLNEANEMGSLVREFIRAIVNRTSQPSDWHYCFVFWRVLGSDIYAVKGILTLYSWFSSVLS